MKVSTAYLESKLEEYVSSFLSGPETASAMIKLKLEHTFMVKRNAVAIAESLGLKPKEVEIASIIGLFHDFGRFVQFQRYGTFNDAESADHAELGLKELEREKIPYLFNTGTREILVEAIRNHNKKFPMYTDRRIELFSKIIRDADKLDIFRILIEYYRDITPGKRNVIEFGLEDRGICTKYFIDSILNFETPDYRKAEGAEDLRLMRASWVYDFSFPVTFDLFKESGFLSETFTNLPRDEEIERVFQHLTDYVKENSRVGNNFSRKFYSKNGSASRCRR